MTRTILLTSLFLSALLQAASLRAQEPRSYLGGQIGMFLPIESLVYGDQVGTGGRVTYNPGLMLSVLGGRRFDSGIRAEAELDYRRLGTDRFLNLGKNSRIYSDIRNYGLMANILYDFRNRTVVTPYIGAGVGLAVTEFGRGTSNGSRLWSDDRDVTVAYQGLGGFALRLSGSTSLDFVYHHYAIPRLHFDTLSAQFRGPNLCLGIRHWF